MKHVSKEWAYETPHPHITDYVSIREYLAMGYTLQEDDPYWVLFLNNQPYATVDAAQARAVLDFPLP